MINVCEQLVTDTRNPFRALYSSEFSLLTHVQDMEVLACVMLKVSRSHDQVVTVTVLVAHYLISILLTRTVVSSRVETHRKRENVSRQ